MSKEDQYEALKDVLDAYERERLVMLKGIEEAGGHGSLLSLLTDEENHPVQKQFRALPVDVQYEAIKSEISDRKSIREHLSSLQPIDRTLLLRRFEKEARKIIVKGYGKKEKDKILSDFNSLKSIDISTVNQEKPVAVQNVPRKRLSLGHKRFVANPKTSKKEGKNGKGRDEETEQQRSDDSRDDSSEEKKKEIIQKEEMKKSIKGKKMKESSEKKNEEKRGNEKKKEESGKEKKKEKSNDDNTDYDTDTDTDDSTDDSTDDNTEDSTDNSTDNSSSEED